MGKENLDEGDVVLCTVDRIENTTVFVDIEDNGKGTIITSEVAPGRIRNLRDYVVPNKKIVCKVLEIDKSGTVHLSLRRVSAKEKEKVMEKHARTKSAIRILESVLENPKQVIEKIKNNEGRVYDFLQKAKDEPELLEKYVNKKEAKKILEILKKRKEKKVEVKAKFELKTTKQGGINMIKKILSEYEENIKYQKAGEYILTIKAKDYKQANKKRDKILEQIEQKAEQKDIEFEVEQK